ncbi:MAG: DUF2231 domain-containing protein [Myxococcota bacterium]
MLPDPLHPAVVHFPIVLAVLAPFVLAGLLLALRGGRLPQRAWLIAVALQAAIVGLGWVTMETGEHEEERVERVVARSALHEHEEAAEWFVWMAGATLPLAALGLLRDRRLAGAARVAALVGTLVTAAAVARVGHTGGELVYTHGAALAYLDRGTTAKAVGSTIMGQILDGAAHEAAGAGSPGDDGRSRRGHGGDD